MSNNYENLLNSLLSYMYIYNYAKVSKMAAWGYLYEFISPSQKSIWFKSTSNLFHGKLFKKYYFGYL